MHGLRRLGLEGAIGGVLEVADGAGIERGGGGGALLVLESEERSEGLDGAADAVPGRAAEFDEIDGGGDGDEELAAGSEDAAEFGRVHAGGDGEDFREGFADARDDTIGIGDEPMAVGVAPGGEIDGGDGDIDAGSLETVKERETAEIEAIAAAGIEDGVVTGGSEQTADGVEKGRGDAGMVEAAAGGDGFRGVARVL